MHIHQHRLPRHGFTVVELLIVIVVLGILAGITVVGYGKVQNNSKVVALTSDLAHARDSMEISATETKLYPSTLPSDITPSKNVSFNLVTNPVIPYYQNLTTMQKALLLKQTCDDLIGEGRGKSPNGNTTYITSCTVPDSSSFDISSSWKPYDFDAPIQANDLTNYGDTIAPGQSWHSEKHFVSKSFYYALSDRYQTSGGTWPIAAFWSGSPSESLPPPNPPGSYADTYCLEAVYAGADLPTYHIITNGAPAEGGC